MTYKEYKELTAKRCEEAIESQRRKKMNDEEMAFRKGYHHGFIAARLNPAMSESEIREWRYFSLKELPPNSEIPSEEFEEPFSHFAPN